MFAGGDEVYTDHRRLRRGHLAFSPFCQLLVRRSLRLRRMFRPFPRQEATLFQRRGDKYIFRYHTYRVNRHLLQRSRRRTRERPNMFPCNTRFYVKQYEDVSYLKRTYMYPDRKLKGECFQTDHRLDQCYRVKFADRLWSQVLSTVLKDCKLPQRPRTHLLTLPQRGWREKQAKTNMHLSRSHFHTYFSQARSTFPFSLRHSSFENRKLFLRRRRTLRKRSQHADMQNRLQRWFHLFQNQSLPASSFFYTSVPCLPSALRPLFLHEGNIFSSDINKIYHLILVRSFRLNYWMFCRLVPPHLVRYEILLVQSANNIVFASADTTHKTLCARIQGKQGQLRQNLLGKRVDYSARSVIVSAPLLSLNACGIPRRIFIRLFEPILVKVCLELQLARNLKGAKSFLRDHQYTNSYLLDRVIGVASQGYPVLLNRAPTLHRLGVQAFFPRLLGTKAIQLHPLVCSSFNADFDGDQMGLHLPISLEGKTEARFLVLAVKNWYLPANGDIALAPTQDMILGISFLTHGPRAEQRTIPFLSVHHFHRLFRFHSHLSKIVHSCIWCPLHTQFEPEVQNKAEEGPIEVSITSTGHLERIYSHKYERASSTGHLRQRFIKTTLGRLIFNTACGLHSEGSIFQALYTEEIGFEPTAPKRERHFSKVIL